MTKEQLLEKYSSIKDYLTNRLNVLESYQDLETYNDDSFLESIYEDENCPLESDDEVNVLMEDIDSYAKEFFASKGMTATESMGLTKNESANNYAGFPDDMVEELRECDTIMRSGINSMKRGFLQIGEAAYRAQKSYASHNNSGFYDWYTKYHLKKTFVYECIDCYQFVVRFSDDETILSNLPKSLLLEAAKKSAPQELKEGVINGDITTLKQYKEIKAELEATKKAKEEAEQARKEAEAKASRKEFEADNVGRNFTRIERENQQLGKEAVKAELARKEMQAERDRLKEELEAAKNAPPVIETTGVPQEEYDRLKREYEDFKQNRPVQVQKVTERVTVKPPDYENLKRENAMLRAHAEGQSLNEKAMIDESVSQYRSTYDDEMKSSRQMDELFSAIRHIPHDEEINESVRCWIKHGLSEEERAVADLKKLLVDMRDVCNALDNALNKPRKLRVIK